MMKSVLLALSVVVGASIAGCRNEGNAQTPAVQTAQAACARVVSLCQGGDADRRECERTMSEVRPGVDAENAARTARCVNEARTCGEASGCLAGGAARAGANMLRDFTNGFTR